MKKTFLLCILVLQGFFLKGHSESSTQERLAFKELAIKKRLRLHQRMHQNECKCPFSSSLLPPLSYLMRPSHIGEWLYLMQEPSRVESVTDKVVDSIYTLVERYKENDLIPMLGGVSYLGLLISFKHKKNMSLPRVKTLIKMIITHEKRGEKLIREAITVAKYVEEKNKGILLEELESTLIGMAVKDDELIVKSYGGKKKKRRFSPSKILSSLADSCSQLGTVAGLFGPEKGAAMNIASLFFRTVAKITGKSKKNAHQSQEEKTIFEEEKMVEGLSKEELASSLLTMMKTVNNLMQPQQTRSLSGDSSKAEEKNDNSGKSFIFRTEQKIESLTAQDDLKEALHAFEFHTNVLMKSFVRFAPSVIAQKIKAEKRIKNEH